ncbi:hypothetical protein [Bacterioplanoides sp.]|uniref:hypothetical protein n=1 Tax=Bacterioplanoides sp. TaxID=2066072 RepID=UPI003B00B977
MLQELYELSANDATPEALLTALGRERLNIIALAFCRAAYRFRPEVSELSTDADFLKSELYQAAYQMASSCALSEAIHVDVFNAIVKLSPEYRHFRR